jgi:hypothetical protein
MNTRILVAVATMALSAVVYGQATVHPCTNLVPQPSHASRLNLPCIQCHPVVKGEQLKTDKRVTDAIAKCEAAKAPKAAVTK